MLYKKKSSSCNKIQYWNVGFFFFFKVCCNLVIFSKELKKYSSYVILETNSPSYSSITDIIAHSNHRETGKLAHQKAPSDTTFPPKAYNDFCL